MKDSLFKNSTSLLKKKNTSSIIQVCHETKLLRITLQNAVRWEYQRVHAEVNGI